MIIRLRKSMFSHTLFYTVIFKKYFYLKEKAILFVIKH